jgi:hypothetical protein
MNLPYFRRPPEFQGTGKDPVWECDDSQLGPDLVYRPDPAHSGHGFIEPARPMTLDEFQQALARTPTTWALVTLNIGGQTMPVDPRIQIALNGPSPFEELRALVRRLQVEGDNLATILELFEHTRQQLRDASRAEAEDIVVEVMDCLVGWCSPHVSLEPNQRQ